jgi:hypothetical protein
MLICFDLDDTISAAPDFYRALMEGLKAQGCEVHVLTGSPGPASQEELDVKKAQLESLGCGDCYDKLIVVGGPEDHVAEEKVNYMTHVGASALIDDRKKNCKAARKAGFLALRHLGPK